MPQTLLGLLALAILTQLTFSQQQVTMKSYQNQLRDEFSVAASGMLMEAMELLAARPFDSATTPGEVLSHGFPDSTRFGSLGPSGAEASRACDLFEIDLAMCNDLDDFSREDYWWPAEVELSNGHTLPFEVQVNVDYVLGGAPDTPVSFETTNKRVVLLVRTPLLPNEGPFIHLERVIAYDPSKAVADCIDVNASVVDAVARCSTARSGGPLLPLPF
ncbi:MAG: hypothetical protein ABJF88_07945 [Rhodothermales bacterium]